MHHSRRKSGHGSSTNTSMTDVRKAVAASEVSSSRHKPSRRNTSQTTSKSTKSSRDRDRDRDREWDDERGWEDERESFPQYCMSCEKQFVPQDDRFLYCSEACRAYDQNNAPAASTIPPRAQRGSNYPFYASGNPEPKDIIPRASPSRPNSMHFSPPTSPGGGASHMSAITALRSLTIRDPSPPSPTMTATYHGSSGIWPFARGSAASPGSSYARPTSTVFSSTYDTGYYGNYANYGAGYSMTSTDRPLPVRRPGNYSRPKSIELVTPMVGR